MRLPLCVAMMRFILHVHVDCIIDRCSCSCLLVCARRLGFRLIVYAFAFVCCKVAFHITRVSFAFVFFGGLFVCACMLMLRVIVCELAFVICKVAFHITCVYRICVLLSCVWFVCLCLYACSASACVCVCLRMLQGCVPY